MQPLPFLILRSLWRFLITGRSLRGTPTDNATFLLAATRDDRGKPVEKLSGPIWHRLAWRWAVLGVPLLMLATSGAARVAEWLHADGAWVEHDWAHMAVRWWIIGTVTGLCYGVYRIVRHIQTREATREFKEPAWQAACDAMGHRFKASDARVMVDLPDDFEPPDLPPAEPGRLATWLRQIIAKSPQDLAQERRQSEPDLEDEDTTEPSSAELVPVGAAELDTYRPPPWQRLIPRRPVNEDIEDEPVRITLIPGKCSTVTEQNRLKQKVGPVLGMPDIQAKWYMRGRSPYVELRPNHPPPPELTFAEIKHLLAKTDIDHPMIGMSHGRKMEILDFIKEVAHVLTSAPSGSGKTNLWKFILSQLMHFGAATVVLDEKMISHRWAHDLPGCTYAWRIEDIHALLVGIGAEILRRKENAIPDGADVDTPLNVFGVLCVLVEEQNALTDKLRDYWTSVRAPGQPQQSPALSALKAAIYTGREFGVRIFPIAQRASAQIFGANGGDARENFSNILMSDWTKKTWMMLAAGTPWQLCPPGGRGIFARVTVGGDVAIVRVPLITNREARDWALSGVPCPGQQGYGGEVIVIDRMGAPVGAPVKAAEMGDPELVTLKAAAEGNMLPGPPISYDALRKALQRDPLAPQPAGLDGAALTYWLSELREWKTARGGGRPLTLVGTRPGIVYQIDTLNPATGEVEIGYIGQTRQKLSKREDQHRGDKPWSDLIVGSPRPIKELPACSNLELDEAERDAIHRLRPRYNYEHQEGASHAVPLWEQKEDRQLRQRARGLPPWVPEDRYGMSQLSHAGLS